MKQNELCFSALRRARSDRNRPKSTNSLPPPSGVLDQRCVTLRRLCGQTLLCPIKRKIIRYADQCEYRRMLAGQDRVDQLRGECGQPQDARGVVPVEAGPLSKL